MKFTPILCFLLLLVACASDEELALKDKIKKDEELYQAALNFFDDGNYAAASEEFLEIERLYPFSPMATKAKVMAAYSFYQQEEFEESLAVINDFINFHPADADIPYIYYLRGLNYYDRISDIARDQQMASKAKGAFEDVIARFPHSDYGLDAKLKVTLLNDQLAGKEMEIGRFYLRQKKINGAINRFKQVVENYQRTEHIKEALYRLTESYMILGIASEAEKYAAILGHNYPNSKWYKKAYEILNT